MFIVKPNLSFKDDLQNSNFKYIQFTTSFDCVIRVNSFLFSFNILKSLQF